MTLIRKIAGAFGVGLVGWLLDAADYQSSDAPDIYIVQSDEALLAIRLIMGISIAVLISIALFASFRFKVTNKKLHRMRYFIEANKAGKLAELPAEELAEREAMIKELYGTVKPVAE